MTKMLVVHDTVTQTFEALDPGKATAIGLPAFTVGNSLPAAGQVIGEGFLVEPTRTGFLWSGTRWVPIVPSALLNYPTDALVIADKSQSPGSYATSTATGNLFISLAGGGWRQVGIRVYALQTALLADTTPSDGAIGYATDTNLHFNYVNGAWRPMSVLTTLTESGLLSMFTTGNVIGQMAIPQDTARLFIWDGTNWIGQPFRNFDTEAHLLVAAAPDGVLAVAQDTAKVYMHVAGTWKNLAGPTFTTGIALPTTAATGDMFYDIVKKELSVRGATAWEAVGGGCKVAATAPASPNTGAMWLDTTAHELKTWDGTAWVIAPILDMSAGGTFKVPAYFTGTMATGVVTPTATDVPADKLGLAASYYGSEGQLFIKHGAAFTAITPWLGAAANAGKIVVADAHGNPTWGAQARKSGRLLATAAITTGDCKFTFPATQKPTRYVRASGWVYPSGGSGIVLPEFVHAGSPIDMTAAANVPNAWNSVQWDAGGVSDKGSTYLRHDCAWTFKDQTHLDVKSDSYLFFDWEAWFSGTSIRTKWSGNYQSQNDGVLIFSGGANVTAPANVDMTDIAVLVRQFNVLSGARSAWCDINVDWE